MTTPTATQLKVAGLVEVTTSAEIMEAAKNGYPPRGYDATTKKFPLIALAYVSKNWKTPVTPPTPSTPELSNEWGTQWL